MNSNSTARNVLRKTVFTIFFLACQTLFACPLGSPQDGSWDGRWLNTYSGSIDERFPIGMTLSFGEEKIDGKYFYTKTYKDIQISGALKQNRQFVLNELNFPEPFLKLIQKLNMGLNQNCNAKS
jgi:hypothetical protein